MVDKHEPEDESALRSVLNSVRSLTAVTSTSQMSNEPADTAEAAPPLDVVFEILKNQRRRMVLDELAAADGEITIGELAETIAARENDKPVSAVTSKERKRAYVGLYQAHLPKMDDAGVVAYNQDRGILTAGPHADLLNRHLEPVSSGYRRTPLTTALLGVLTLGSLLVETVGGVSTALLALLVLFVASVILTVRRAAQA